MKNYKVVALPKRFEGGDGGGTYTVKSGDTFRGIANRLGIPFKDLEKANPGINYDKLSLGQVLNLPATKSVIKVAAAAAKDTIAVAEQAKAVANKLADKLKDAEEKTSKKDIVINLEGLKKGIAHVESADGTLMMNPTSSATGLYGQLYNEVKDLDELKGVTREQFSKDLDLQNKIFEKRFYEGLPGVPALQKNALELYEEYSPQIKDFNYSYEDIAALSNFLGRQGTREFFASLRDSKEFKAPGINKTPAQYLEGARPSYIIKEEKNGGFVEIDLSEEDALKYADGGYILEELHEGGVPHEHPHPLPPASYYKRIYGHRDHNRKGIGTYIDPSTGYKYWDPNNPNSTQEKAVPESPWNTARFLYDPYYKAQGDVDNIYDSEGNYTDEGESISPKDRYDIMPEGASSYNPPRKAIRKARKHQKEDITKYYRDDLGLSKDEVKEKVKAQMKIIKGLNKINRLTGDYMSHRALENYSVGQEFENEALDKLNPRGREEEEKFKPLKQRKVARAYNQFQKTLSGVSGKEARKNTREEIREADERAEEYLKRVSEDYNLTPKEYKKQLDNIIAYNERGFEYTDDHKYNPEKDYSKTKKKKKEKQKTVSRIRGKKIFGDGGYIVEEVQNYNKGGTVSSIWKERTGTPWSEAKAQGLTDGSYDQNIALRKKLLQGEFDSETFKSTPAKERGEQKSFDYERYDKRIRDKVAKGQTLDDLVKRRLGTRQGLTARFPDLFGENQAVEVADLTDKEAEELKEQGYTLEETTDKTPTTLDWNTPIHQLKMTLLKNKNLKAKSFDDIYEESLKPKGLSFGLDSDKEVGSIQPTFKMNLPEYKRPSSYDPSKSFSENYDELTKYKGLSFDLRSEEEKQIIKDARQKVEDEINALQQKEEESRKGKDKYGPELTALLNRANQNSEQENSIPTYTDPITGRKSRDRSVRKLVDTPIMDAIADGVVGTAKVAGEYIDAGTGLPKKIYEGVSKEVEDLVDKFQKTSILPGKITNDVELLYKAGSAIVNKDYEALLETKYGQDIALKILDQNENPNKYYDLKFKKLNEEEQQWLRRKLEKEGRINTPEEKLKVKEERVIKETPKPEAFVERIGDVKDSYDKKYKLLSYRNQWDNNEGFVYRTTPTKQHRKNSDVYKDVLGVAHFLLDASVDPRNPYSHRNNESYIRRAKANDEWIPAFENVSDNEVRLKYKKPEDILETDIVSAPLRQLKFSDINFNSSQTPKGFRSTVNEVTTNDGDGTYLLFKSRNGYSRFSGGSVVFIFEDKYGNSIVRDFAGSLNTIKKEGDSIQKQYKLKPGELTIGYHDVGSFSAKPKADDNNVLRADQWKGYNNNGYTGGALLIPSKR